MRLAPPPRAEPVPRGLGAIVDVNYRRLALLRHISNLDGATVVDLAEACGLTLAAVRLHLAKLMTAGLVEEERLAPEGPGRPRNRYRVTASAQELLGARALLEQLAVSTEPSA